MSARDVYDNLLEVARRVHQLELVLKEIHESRGASIGTITEDWSGETPHALNERYDEDDSTFGEAVSDLKFCKDYWVDLWVMYVNSHNAVARDRAIKALQNDLDLYHNAIAAEQNWTQYQGSKLLHGGDEVLDFVFGGSGAIVDDAEPEVEFYREPDKPMPPDYHSGSVFVRYERRDTADPRRGMAAAYVHWPIEQ